MNFFQNKLNGIKRRIHSIKYGMFYWNNTDYKIPGILTINGKKKKLRVEGMNMNEFTGICINDCYHLKFLKKKLDKVKTIVDVGANSGMFVIAARQVFPEAKIDCYEPNPHLVDTLSFNAKQLGAVPYFEAVMKNDCMVTLKFTESDLATTVSESGNGSVPGASLKKVIERSGIIDILKLDCEGAEWELMEDIDSWKSIKSLALEYHLWGKSGVKREDLFELLKGINFRLISHKIYNSEQGFVLAINNTI